MYHEFIIFLNLETYAVCLQQYAVPRNQVVLRMIFNAIKVKLELNYSIIHWLLIKLTHS